MAMMWGTQGRGFEMLRPALVWELRAALADLRYSELMER